MRIVDANVLLYVINQDSVHHAKLRGWWEDAVADDEPIGLCWVVLLAFMRIATNPRVFPRPLTASEAVEMIGDWLSHPNIRVVTENNQHWNTVQRLLVASGTAGNLTTDAHLAAIAMTHGSLLVSCDTDFARFDGLQWQNPLRA